jgi:predicted PurR-regulated permease PerM
MNIFKVGFSSWIIFLNLFLLISLFYLIYSSSNEYFLNFPQQIDPMANTKNNQDIEAANNNYTSLLLFIQNNPSKSIKFIQDIKQKFFDNSCQIKSNIDFKNIAQLPLGVTF